MSTFFSGSVDPFLPHMVLLTVAIFASFAVAIGIVMESPKWSVANALVVGGVALEAVCTLLLFGFDEGISNAQQSEIIKLEQSIAYRTLDQEKFLAILANTPFKGQVEIQYVKFDQESFAFATQIDMALRAAGWELQAHPIPIDAIIWPRASGDEISFKISSSGTMIPIPASNLTVYMKNTEDGPGRALFDAFIVSTKFGSRAFSDLELQPDIVRIVIGPRI
jgi:hypothetical protein